MLIIQSTLTTLQLNTFQKKFKKSIGKQTNIYRRTACDSIMCRYFCIEFIEFMLKGKTFLDYIDLFSHNEY